ncbi:hypothetical protein JAN5088_03343 [Jannaschia rubra]|uniref:Uncharacterized protein n=1 Tax=Jannaschia rubra TaxID=282197 RepID=A0A0M6XV90_9RHOB|nr:hypothetical protein JAN5088_03343 [Jannaschia rubra]
MEPQKPKVAGRATSQSGAARQANRNGRAALLVGTLLTLGACAVPVGGGGQEGQGISEDVRAQLVAMAAPYQDLQSVELRAEDGCYWYSHAGPVETTMLPLRTSNGNKICGGSASSVAG